MSCRLPVQYYISECHFKVPEHAFLQCVTDIKQKKTPLILKRSETTKGSFKSTPWEPQLVTGV